MEKLLNNYYENCTVFGILKKTGTSYKKCIGAAIFLFILLCVIIDYLIISNINLIFIYLFLIDLILFFFFFVIAIAFFCHCNAKQWKNTYNEIWTNEANEEEKKIISESKIYFHFHSTKSAYHILLNLIIKYNESKFVTEFNIYNIEMIDFLIQYNNEVMKKNKHIIDKSKIKDIYKAVGLIVLGIVISKTLDFNVFNYENLLSSANLISFIIYLFICLIVFIVCVYILLLLESVFDYLIKFIYSGEFLSLQKCDQFNAFLWNKKFELIQKSESENV